MTAGKRAPGVPRSLRQVCSKAGRSKSISGARRSVIADWDTFTRAKAIRCNPRYDRIRQNEKGCRWGAAACKRVPTRGLRTEGDGWQLCGKFHVERLFLASKKLICSGGT